MSISVVLKKLTLLRMRTFTSFHSFHIASVILLQFMYAALWTVAPPKMAAEDPVVDVNVKDMSLNITTRCAQKA